MLLIKISFLKSLLGIFLSVIIAIPLVLYPLLYFYQDKLLFFPRKIDNNYLNSLKKQYSDAKEVQIMTPDKITLHGWYVKNSQKEQSPLLIYFGGNAEEVSNLLWDIDQFKNWSLLLVNYRGYGLSEGSPSEKNLFNDAVLLYDEFSQKTEIDNNKIVAIGRSLGTGVAVYLASQRNLTGIILVSPYDSIRSLAQEVYPFVPISLLLKHHFDSLARAPLINIPMLALIAQEDKIISPRHSLALIKAWGGVTYQIIIPDSDHMSIATRREYWKSITAFLNKLENDAH